MNREGFPAKYGGRQGLHERLYSSLRALPSIPDHQWLEILYLTLTRACMMRVVYRTTAMSCVPALKRGNDPILVFCGPRLSEVDFTPRAFCMARSPVGSCQRCRCTFQAQDVDSSRLKTGSCQESRMFDSSAVFNAVRECGCLGEVEHDGRSCLRDGSNI